MKIPQMIAAEFRRLFSTPMAILALLALVCVPVLYGGLYLWANQDPYASLSAVPAAVVVRDEGATVAGKHRTIGDEVAAELIASNTFDWRQVDSDEAERGMQQGRYDFAVEIPSGFTAAIASISSDQPQQADMVLLTNDANNYLASTIGKQAVETIRATVTEKVVKEAGLTMLDALNQIRVKLADAADGASRLADGLATAKDGSGQLADGSAQLADGTAQIHDGAAALATGTSGLATGLDTLSDGASQVAGGTAQLAEVADRIGDAVAEADAALPQAREDIRQSLVDQGLAQDRVDRVMARLDTLGSTLDNAASRVSSARDKVDQLNDGAQQVSSGAATAASGAHTAADGAAQLSTATDTAATGAAALRDGAAKLNTGIGALSDGAVQLRDGLASGRDQIPDTTAQTRQAQATTLGDPVAVDRNSQTQAQNYGAGLAPFFAALAAWIGIYALFLIVKPISRRAVTALHSPVRVTLAGWATPAILGGVQMIGLFAVLSMMLGFRFANPLAALGVLVLASATYTAIILALNVWLNAVGQFLGLVLMVLQLVTAGGTFPWQTLPAPLQALHHALPMGYVVDAMRQLMYGGDLARVGTDLATLGTWLVGALVLSILGVARMTRTRTLRDLQPSLIG